ncbi:MAG: hypothetical protein NC299_02475 [Lachnospiraceae bacterium]|nr:hypothetical protein [Ruminococcus sp.]MCM1274215.1 hypothetical protein [Lachnospiraceae bacterium]
MEGLELIKKIVSDELCELAGAVMGTNFLEESKPLSEYNDEEYDGDFTFSEDGAVFAENGRCFYILLEDGSIGCADADYYECGRVAENMVEFLEILLNTAYCWQNYLTDTDKPLDKSGVAAWESKGREQFAKVYGNELPPYDEAAKAVAERFGLRIIEDITEELMPKLYKTMNREPLFAVSIDGWGELSLVGKD